MVDILDQSDASIVAGNPLNSRHGLINAREIDNGMNELVLGSGNHGDAGLMSVTISKPPV